MRNRWILPLTLALLAVASGGEGEDAPAEAKLVPALRYRMKVMDGAGPERWLVEFYFPDTRVACNIAKDWREHGGKLVEFTKTNAFFSEARHRPPPGYHGPIGAERARKIQVPAALAGKILELARLDRERRRLARETAAAIRAAGLLPDP